jgi:hypothetical protein
MITRICELQFICTNFSSKDIILKYGCKRKSEESGRNLSYIAFLFISNLKQQNMKRLHLSIILSMIFIIFSCKPKNEEQPVFTTQINYDVVLKNPDTVQVYWNRFMDDSTRIRFLKNITDPVLAGEIIPYVWKNIKLVPVSVTEFKNRFAWNKSKNLPDSINQIDYRVDLNEVTKIRYYEEWRVLKTNLVIDKRILAVTLIRDSYTSQGEYRGTEPLFYIFYDKDFLAKFEQMNQ